MVLFCLTKTVPLKWSFSYTSNNNAQRLSQNPQTSNMKSFTIMFNGIESLTIVARLSTLDIYIFAIATPQNTLMLNLSQCEKCPIRSFFWTVFSRIKTEYGK